MVFQSARPRFVAPQVVFQVSIIRTPYRALCHINRESNSFERTRFRHVIIISTFPFNLPKSSVERVKYHLYIFLDPHTSSKMPAADSIVAIILLRIVSLFVFHINAVAEKDVYKRKYEQVQTRSSNFI